MTEGTRRNDTSKLGPFNRVSPGHQHPQGPWQPEPTWPELSSQPAPTEWQPELSSHLETTLLQPESTFWPESSAQPGSSWPARPDQQSWPPRQQDELGLVSSTGRPVGSPGKTARKRVGKVVPAAAVAAALAVGAAAYTLLGGGGQPQAAPVNAALGASGTPRASVAAGAGQANGMPGSILKVATAVGPGATGAIIRAATRAPAATPTAKPSAAAPAAPAAAPAPRATSASTTTSKAVTTGSSGSAATAKSATLSCKLSGGQLPDNVSAIVSFLLAHGYSHNAAAGIAGNIYQESKGNPESVGTGGGGLIGWTPLPSGFVTGNVTADLNTQLAALLTYNQGWAQYVPALNAAATPAAAADIYVTDFERAGIPAAATREASAQDVARACGI